MKKEKTSFSDFGRRVFRRIRIFLADRKNRRNIIMAAVVVLILFLAVLTLTFSRSADPVPTYVGKEDDTASQNQETASSQYQFSEGESLTHSSSDSETDVSREESGTDRSGKQVGEEESDNAEETTAVSTEDPAENPSYVVAVGIGQYVTLGDYIGLEVSYTPAEIEITDDDVQEVLEEYQARYTTSTEITDRDDAREGDTVTLSYEGRMDGEFVADASSSRDILTIGQAGYIEGFEEGLIGVKVGETVRLNLTFPDTYPEEYAGRDIEFTVTVEKIEKTSVPEIDDDLAKTAGEAKTLKKWKKVIKKRLKAEAEAEQEEEKLYLAWGQAVDNASVNEYPYDILKEYESSVYAVYEYYASMLGMDYDEMVDSWGLTDEEIEEDAKAQFKDEATAQAVADKEEISYTEEEYEAFLEKLVEDGMAESTDALQEEYSETYLKNMCLYDKVYEFVYENAVFVEEKE